MPSPSHRSKHRNNPPESPPLLYNICLPHRIPLRPLHTLKASVRPAVDTREVCDGVMAVESKSREEWEWWAACWIARRRRCRLRPNRKRARSASKGRVPIRSRLALYPPQPASHHRRSRNRVCAAPAWALCVESWQQQNRGRPHGPENEDTHTRIFRGGGGGGLSTRRGFHHPRRPTDSSSSVDRKPNQSFHLSSLRAGAKAGGSKSSRARRGHRRASRYGGKQANQRATSNEREEPLPPR
jgi:hypothetical protein